MPFDIVQLPVLIQCRFCGRCHVGQHDISAKACIEGIPEKRFNIGELVLTCMDFAEPHGGGTQTKVRIVEYISPWDYLQMEEINPSELSILGSTDLGMQLPKGKNFISGSRFYHHDWIVKVEPVNSEPKPDDLYCNMCEGKNYLFAEFMFTNESQISKIIK